MENRCTASASVVSITSRSDRKAVPDKFSFTARLRALWALGHLGPGAQAQLFQVHDLAQNSTESSSKGVRRTKKRKNPPNPQEQHRKAL